MDERISLGGGNIALILAGGVGLGAYQAGAYAALQEATGRRPDWLAASSVGAVNAAVIAGSPVDAGIRQLERLWSTADPAFTTGQALWGAWPHARSWMSVLRGRLFGVPGHFHPRIPLPIRPFRSLYDLAPMRDQLLELVDFDRLNGGDIRFTLATTDIETGETVLFDTGRGDCIEVDHLLASCGFLPEFAPIELAGRLLGDGGLSANAPVEAVLADEERPRNIVCFVVDLFARDGSRPSSFEEAMARKTDLVFANQTHQRLEAYRRERTLHDRIAGLLKHLPADSTDMPPIPSFLPDNATVMHLSYRAPAEEAGPERPFDLSPKTIINRWRAGASDMREALRMMAEEPLATPVRSVRRRLSA